MPSTATEVLIEIGGYMNHRPGCRAKQLRTCDCGLLDAQQVLIEALSPEAREARSDGSVSTVSDGEAKELEALQLRYARLLSAARQLVDAIDDTYLVDVGEDIRSKADRVSALLDLESRPDEEEKS
jgi:hypothetical protein